MALLSLLASPLARAQTITNGGFENSLSDSNTTVDPGWDSYDARNISVTSGSGNVDSGTYAARMNWATGSGAGQQLNQEITGLTPGASYTLTGALSVTAITTSGSSDAGLQINVRDDKYSANLAQYVQSTTTGGFIGFSLTFTAPADGTAWIATDWYAVSAGSATLDSFELGRTAANTSSAYANLVNSMNPVGYWRLNETSGTTAADSSGNSRNGTYTNGVVQGAKGVIAGDAAATFDGTNDHILLSGIDLSQWLGGTGSLSFWMKTAQSGKDTCWQAPAVTGVEHAGTTNDVMWGWLSANGRICMAAGNDAGARSPSPMNDNTWHHVAVTRNGSTGTCQVYVDGVLKSTSTGETGTKTTAFSALGRLTWSNGSHVYYRGSLDEIAAFNRVLSAEEVAALAVIGAHKLRVTRWVELNPR